MGALCDFYAPLEHFAIKWTPVNRNKKQQNKDLERSFESIKTQRALKLLHPIKIWALTL